MNINPNQLNQSNSTSNLRQSFDFYNQTQLSSNLKYTNSLSTLSTNSKLRNLSSNPSLRQAQSNNTSMLSLSYNLRQQDPRPLLEKSFQLNASNKVFSFLVSNSFSYPIASNNKLLSSLGKNDFLKIFTFIYSFIRKDTELKINKLEDDIPRIMYEIGYPGTISKHTLIGIGAPNSNGQIIGFLLWMVELAEYIISYEEKCIKEVENYEILINKREKERNRLNTVVLTKDEMEMISRKDQESFLFDAYQEMVNSSNQKTFSISREGYEDRVNGNMKEIKESLRKKQVLMDEYKKEGEAYKEYLNQFNELDGRISNINKEIVYIDNKISSTDMEISYIKGEFESKQNEERIQKNKIQSLIQEENRLVSAIEKQEMTKDIYERKLKIIENNNYKIVLCKESMTEVTSFINNSISELVKTSTGVVSNIEFIHQFIISNGYSPDSLNVFKEVTYQVEMIYKDYNNLASPLDSIYKILDVISNTGTTNIDSSTSINLLLPSFEEFDSLIESSHSYLDSYIEVISSLNTKLKTIQERTLEFALLIESKIDETKNNLLISNEEIRLYTYEESKIDMKIDGLQKENQHLIKENKQMQSLFEEGKSNHEMIISKGYSEIENLNEEIKKVRKMISMDEEDIHKTTKLLNETRNKVRILSKEANQNIIEADRLLKDLIKNAEEVKQKQIKKLRRFLVKCKKSSENLEEYIEKDLEYTQGLLFESEAYELLSKN